MCGFVGAFAFADGVEPYRERLHAGLKRIRHRGPDASSHYAGDAVYLGHNRLSIIDLSDAANQPLKAADEPAWIVYNGEIYNYQALKPDRQGRFLTSGDTEVVRRSSRSCAAFMRLRSSTSAGRRRSCSAEILRASSRSTGFATRVSSRLRAKSRRSSR
jgi:asparagine synthetase B (glutamine-hydrolysing)